MLVLLTIETACWARNFIFVPYRSQRIANFR
jgi:hypothetical protein